MTTEQELPAPAIPCDSCLHDRSIEFDDFVIAVFCSHRNAGAVWVPGVRRWAVYSPISEAEFVRTLGLERSVPQRPN